MRSAVSSIVVTVTLGTFYESNYGHFAA
jgi:hypothetical protein